MREFKFRIWDPFNENMMNQEDDRYLDSLSKIWVDFDILKEGENDPIMMQFTGLQDKNGVDIYEGDILSDWVKTDEGLIKSHNQVFWNLFTASYHLDHSFNQDKSSSRELWQEINDFKYKISGNIYQNPELLK